MPLRASYKLASWALGLCMLMALPALAACPGDEATRVPSGNFTNAVTIVDGIA